MHYCELTSFLTEDLTPDPKTYSYPHFHEMTPPSPLSNARHCERSLHLARALPSGMLSRHQPGNGSGFSPSRSAFRKNRRPRSRAPSFRLRSGTSSPSPSSSRSPCRQRWSFHTPSCIAPRPAFCSPSAATAIAAAPSALGRDARGILGAHALGILDGVGSRRGFDAAAVRNHLRAKRSTDGDADAANGSRRRRRSPAC